MRLLFKMIGIALALGLLFAFSFALADGRVEPHARIIEEEAFLGDVSIETLVLNENIEKVGPRAFAGCVNLKTVYCFSNDIDVDETAFEGAGSLEVYCYQESAMERLALEKGYEIKRPIFYDIKCDTLVNGAAGLPITWEAEWLTPRPGEELECMWQVIRKGDAQPSASINNNETILTFTPEKAGSYTVHLTVQEPRTGSSFSKESIPVEVEQAVYFGTYEQDGKSSTLDALEWTVLDVQNGEALLITKKIIRNDSYFNPDWIKYKYTYWAESCVGSSSDINWWGVIPLDSMKITGITPDHVPLEDRTFGKEEDIFYVHSRYWLNEIFYESAFSDDEKARIILVHNINEDNPEYGTESGPDSWDNVFFLSYSEMMRYMPTAASRKASMTTMAVRESGDNSGKYWWLRTSGAKQWFAMYIYGSNGYISHYGSDVGHDNLGYRPCIRIRVGG
ncbi:MAG: leucine-rich repeat protein [Clostridia bacterium]|nr:leucine-rich repeat protein [Clostridia bacterium]